MTMAQASRAEPGKQDPKKERRSRPPDTSVAQAGPAGENLRLDPLPDHATTRALRQAQVLRMQQQQGNVWVQRALNTQPQGANAEVVQRDLSRRELGGIRVVMDLCQDINNAGREFGIPPELVGVIVMHESQAGERSLFVLDSLADAAERAQAAIQGETASIGVGQMRVGTARRLRQQYPALRSADSVVDDLLNRRQAVRYVAAHLSQIKSQLDAFLAQEHATLGPAETLEMLALAYNIGWPNLRDRNLRDPNFGADIRARVATIRGRSGYLRHTTAHLALMRLILMRAVVLQR